MPYRKGPIATTMKNIMLYLFISFVFLCFFHGNSIVGTLSNAYAQQDWKQEYSTVCAKTQNAVTLSAEELKDYIERCDVLHDAKRLKMCRDIYEFTLEYKNMKK
jgi:hypothetical protein